MEPVKENDRVIIDFDSVRKDVENVLNEVKEIRSDKMFSKTVGAESVQKIKEYEGLIYKRLNDNFNLVVVGDFKRGKTTFINSLIGENILPSAVTPETVTINKVSYAETNKVEAVLKNGRRAAMEKTELKREELDRILKEFPAQVDYIDIKDNHEFLKGISIVDTPGIGDLFKTFDEQVTDFLLNADAVVYLISARVPLSITEQSFLASSVMPQSFSRILLVINMADCLEDVDDIEKVKTLVKAKAKDISPNIYVYAISALDELCRKQNLKRPEPEISDYLEKNYLELESALQNDIMLNKEVIKSTRGIALTRIMLSNASSRIKLIESSLRTNTGKLAASQEEFLSINTDLVASIEKRKRSLSSEIDMLRIEANEWMSEFLVRLLQEIENIHAKASTNELERHFQFYMLDVVKKAMLSCVEYHQKGISDKLSEEIKGLAKDLSQTAFGSIDAQIADCITDVSWTNVDTAMFVAGDVFGLSQQLGLIYVAVQAVAGFVRQSIFNKKQTDFLTSVLDGYDSIRQEILTKVDDIYEKLKRTVATKIDDIYQSQIDHSLDAIKQAKEITQNEEFKTEKVVAYLDSVLESLEGLTLTLNKYD